MYSLELERMVAFQQSRRSNISPSWSSDGMRLALSSSRSGDPEIYSCNPSGGDLHRITEYRGPDVSPAWNPKTNAQIAWISGRTGLPQLYIMASDGSDVQRMTDGGYATSPAGRRTDNSSHSHGTGSMGPAPPAARTSTSWMSPANAGYNSPTGKVATIRHPGRPMDGIMVFQSQRGSQTAIWTMLADGTQLQQLTHGGSGSMPDWSWK